MLGRALGNIFLPIVAKVLPYLNQLVYALRELAEWIVRLLGYEDFDWGNATGADNSAIGDLLDDTEGVADNLDKATDNAKKFKNQLQGFDKLNNLTTTDTSDTDGGKGTGGINTGLLDTALDDALSRYQQKWDAAFENMNQSFSTFADSVKKAFEEGGAFGVGAYFAKTIIDSLNSVTWDDYKEMAKKFGENFGAFIAGLLSPDEDGNTLFGAVGTAIAESINVVIEFFDGWERAFNGNKGWDNLGNSIGQLVGNAIDNIEWDKAIDVAGRIGKGVAKAINSFLKSDSEPVKKIGTAAGKLVKMGVEGWYGFVTTFEFSTLGQKIADGINAFFAEMNEPVYDERGFKTNMTGWQKLGYSISNSITGIADSIITALEGVDWIVVGQGIGDLIGSIEWGNVVWKLSKMAENLVKAISEAIVGWAEKDPLSAAIVGLVATAKLTGLTATLTSLIGTKIGGIKKIQLAGTGVTIAGLSVLFDMDEGGLEENLTASVFTAVGASLISGKWQIALPVLLVSGLWSVLKWDREGGVDENGRSPLQAWWHDLIQDIDKFFGFKEESTGWDGKTYTVTIPFSVKFGNWIEDFKKELGELPKNIFNWDNWLENVFNWDEAGEWFESAKEAFEKAFSGGDGGGWVDIGGYIVEGILDGIVGVLSGIAEPFVDLFTWIYNGICDVFGISSPAKEMMPLGEWIAKGLLEGILSPFKKIGDWLKTNIVEPIKTFFSKDENKPGIQARIATKWNDLKEKWNSLVSNAQDKVVDFKARVATKWNDLKTSWGNLTGNIKDKTADFKARVATKWNDLKTSWGNLTGNIKDKTADFKARVATKWNDLKGTWNALTGKLSGFTATITAKFNDSFSAPLKKAWNALANTINAGIEQINKILPKKMKISNMPTLATGGFVPNGGGQIKRYASGGIPDIGTLFVAGEAGAEIVGNARGGTEVLNESQIAASIAAGVENANAQQNAIMRQQNQLLREEISVLHAILEKTGITDGDIFQSVRRSNDNYTRINGHGAFSY